MISFHIQDMTCKHCERSITQAVAGVDMAARLRFDIGLHRLDIEPGQASAAQLAQAIRAAGYTPLPIAGSPADLTGAVVVQAPARRGCCCG